VEAIFALLVVLQAIIADLPNMLPFKLLNPLFKVGQT
jgi:hypothetical protein